MNFLGIQNMQITTKINRYNSLKNKKGKFWCDFCDAYLVYPGQKCPKCGKKQLKRKLKK